MHRYSRGRENLGQDKSRWRGDRSKVVDPRGLQTKEFTNEFRSVSKNVFANLNVACDVSHRTRFGEARSGIVASELLSGIWKNPVKDRTQATAFAQDTREVIDCAYSSA